MSSRYEAERRVANIVRNQLGSWWVRSGPDRDEGYVAAKYADTVDNFARAILPELLKRATLSALIQAAAEGDGEEE